MAETESPRRLSLATDVWTVMWKELRELRQGTGGSRLGSGGLSQALISIGVFGILLPYNFGKEWITSPSTLLFWAWIPMLLISTVVAQSFAGERERHTLESLLATRLSDEALLLGKVGAAVAYGWGISLGALLLSVITTNVRFRSEGPLLYTPDMAVSIIGLTLLISVLAAGVGVLVSLRASTVRQAQQTLSLASLVLVFGSMYGLRALPIDWSALTRDMGHGVLPSTGVLLAIGVLLLVDAALLAAGMLRFRRSRLILD